MKVQIFHCVGSEYGANKVFKALEKRGVVEAKLSREQPEPGCFVVGWGRNVAGVQGYNTSVNRDKFWQLQKMKEKGVPTLEFTLDTNGANMWLGNGCVVMGRAAYHEAGEDIRVFLPLPGVTVAGSAYYTKYVVSESEWRFHIWNGRSLQGYPKVNGDRRTLETGMMIEGELGREELRAIAKRAVEALSYQWGVVDVLGCGRVLEVNTAPVIEGPVMAEQYAMAIERSCGA